MRSTTSPIREPTSICLAASACSVGKHTQLLIVVATSARYAVVRASTCECARSARDVRDPTVQTRSQYRSKRLRKPGGDINDAEDSIREGQWPLHANPRLIMCRVCRDPFLAQPRPFAPESRISYLESCAYGTRGFICEGFSRKNSCDRQQRVWYRLLGGEQKRSSPSSAGNLTVRLLVGSRKTLRIKGSGRQRGEENCHSGRWSIGIATGVRAAEEQL